MELPDKITPGTPFQIGPNAPCPCGSGRKPRPPASVTVIHAFRSFSDMPEVIHPPSTPRTWGGWEAPAPVIAGVFDAAAAYHRAAPWTLIDDRLALYVRTERGTTWSPIVMGGGDAVFGVAMPETLGPCLAARPGAEPEAVLVELRVVARPASPPRRRR